jgi:RHS repeat-associated protein
MNTAQFTDPAGHTKSFTYNFRMQLTQSTDGLGNTTSFAYGARGYPLSKTDGNGNTSTFGHDANGRLTSQTFSDGTTETYTYDSNGNLTSATNENTKLTFTYDALNRLVSVTDGRFPKSIQYTYDHNGHRTALMDSEGGTFTYGFDKSGRPISIASPGGATAEITYDAANRPVAVSYSNGVAAAIKPDGNGHPLSIDWTSKAKAQIAAFQYTYDKNGNPAAITDMALTHAYAYDSLNRITSAKNPASTAESFTYDGAGNRTASAGSSYKYDAAGRLISAAGVSYTYDNNGNLIKRIDSKGTTTYTYDIQNRLVAINLPGGSTATYKYDALGRRIEKNVGGTVTQYVYDGLNILLEFDGNDKLQARYTHGLNLDQPMMMERGGAMYFYHSDALGSIAAVTDSTGKAVCGYSYDSFGQATACQGLENPYSFAGREYDSESGLYYMRARYYDPATGRFITNDPLDVTQLLLNGQPTSLPWAPQLLNGYSYAANDPVVKRDPLGLKPINITSGPQPYGPINVVALQQAGSPVLLLDQGTLMVPTQVGGGGGLPSTSFMVGTAAIPFVMLATAVQPETLGFTGPMLGQVTTLEEVGVVTEGTVPVVVQATEGTLAPGALGGWVQGVGSNAWGYWIWLAPK